MEYAINQDHRIAFDTFGSGPVVVLHHGWLGNRRHWQDLGYVEALQNEFTVVTLDARAHGDSDIPTDLERYQRSDLADDTITVLDHLGVERAHYLGYSMGAYVGIGVLARYRHRLVSLALGGWDPISGFEENLRLIAEFPIEKVLPLVVDMSPWITDAHLTGIDAIRQPMSIQDLPPEMLTSSDLPLLLWSGTEDPCFRALNTLAAEIPRAEFFSVAAADHVGGIELDTSNTISRVRQFLLSQ